MFKDRFLTTIFFIEIWLLALTILLLFFSYPSLPNFVPFWYSQTWGPTQLGPKITLFSLPLCALLIFIVNNGLVAGIQKNKDLLSGRALALVNLFLLGSLTFFLFRLVLSVSNPVLPWFLRPEVVVGLAFSFSLSAILTYPSLKIFQKFGLVDNPQTHLHPAMLLTRAVPRGGSLPLFLSFIAASIFLFHPGPQLLRLFLVGFAVIVVGLIDDKYDLNPYLRFSLQVGAAALIVLSGLKIDYINHPLGLGVLSLTKPVFSLGLFSFSPLSVIFSLVWIIWTMNMISWSNGVDGQFPLITTVAAIVIGILGLSDVNQLKTSGLAFVLAGATLGTLPYSWHRSRVLYGFGATGIGLILAALSILNGTKIATALLVLLVPSLDALVTILRRLKAGRSPFWGDRTHFHHRLLDLGWTQPQIAIFYGLAGSILGLLAVISSGRGKLLAIITAAGVFIFLLTIVNLGTGNAERKDQNENSV